MPTDRLKCVAELGCVGLGRDEVVNFRVRRVEHRHACASAATTHRDDTRRGVIQPKERHRSAGRAARAGHSISGGSQAAECISGAAAGALNLGGVSEGREDRVQRILDGERNSRRASRCRCRRSSAWANSAGSRGCAMTSKSAPPTASTSRAGSRPRRPQRSAPPGPSSPRSTRSAGPVVVQQIAFPQHRHRGKAQLQLVAHPEQCLRRAQLGAPLPVDDVGTGDVVKTGFAQPRLNEILNLFDGRNPGPSTSATALATVTGMSGSS